MSTPAELEASISENEAQLSLVEAALASDPSNSALSQLKTDLGTLLQLTKDSLLEVRRAEAVSEVDRLADAIQEQQPGSSSSVADDLSSLEGMKVSAPTSSSGHRGSQMANAVIVGVEGHQEGETGYEDIKVRVAFSHPTLSRLVVCQYYLEGRCYRPEGKCKWSHGELVRLGEVGAWREADYSRLVEGASVLCKGEDGVWGRGVIDSLVGEEFLIKLDDMASDPVAKGIEDLVPLHALSDNGEDSDDSEDEVTEDLESQSFVPIEIGQGANCGKFGAWEEHTLGLGSRLMQKMGWVVGRGLGRLGREGRLDPVTARVYPQGKSLDWCMERREELGGGDVLDVENILKKEAKEAERKSKKRADDENRRDNSAKSLFDFINVKLGPAGPQGGGEGSGHTSKNGFVNNKNKKKVYLKEETDKKLKIRQFEVGEKISKVEKDITKLKDTFERHKKEPKIAAGIKSKLDEKLVELKSLQTKEKSIKNEEGNRKSKSKLSIF